VSKDIKFALRVVHCVDCRTGSEVLELAKRPNMEMKTVDASCRLPSNVTYFRVKEQIKDGIRNNHKLSISYEFQPWTTEL
jgi:hypothetical protein